jgi:chromosome segregation ATPase
MGKKIQTSNKLSTSVSLMNSVNTKQIESLRDQLALSKEQLSLAIANQQSEREDSKQILAALDQEIATLKLALNEAKDNRRTGIDNSLEEIKSLEKALENTKGKLRSQTMITKQLEEDSVNQLSELRISLESKLQDSKEKIKRLKNELVSISNERDTLLKARSSNESSRVARLKRLGCRT